MPESAFDAAVDRGRLTGRILNIAPTDVSQFVRLDQCQRYMRLRLHEQNGGTGFFKAIDADPVPIPPLLTTSGFEFEQRVEAEIIAAMPSLKFAGGGGRQKTDENDNDAVIQAAAGLGPGERIALLQPKLTVEVEGWRLGGVADLVLASRSIEGRLELLTVDFKSSKTAKLEHRLQAAIYRIMLGRLFRDAGNDEPSRPIAILYRGGSEPVEVDEARRGDAESTLSVTAALLDRVAKPSELDEAAHDLLLGRASLARRIAGQEFAGIPFHLGRKCDGCLYNEVCLKWSVQHDDIALIPCVSEQDKTALAEAGVKTAAQLASLPDADPQLASRLQSTWPVGPRFNELAARARRYRQWRGDDYRPGKVISTGAHGSLPRVAADQNPNLVRVYIDVQQDYLHDRLYLAGALIAASEGGAENPARRRAVVKLTAGPPVSDEVERVMLREWIDETIAAIVELAAPDAEGGRNAPVHLIFFDRADQRGLLAALGRHAESLLAATPLFDFVTQLAAYDSPIATFLSDEVRAHRNYPMLCQSLQSLAIFLKFDWDSPKPFRTMFRKRVFDYLGKLRPDEMPDGDSAPWFTRQARFESSIPLEYAYAAWGELRDAPAEFAQASLADIVAFQTRRLEAIEWISRDLPQNRYTEQRSFALPDLSTFESKARSLAEALREFVALERHAVLGAWKTARLASPEQRMLAGDSFVVRYLEADQAQGTAVLNRENARRSELREAVVAGENGKKAYPVETRWSQEGLKIRLRLESAAGDDVKRLLVNASLREGGFVVISPTLSEDTRKPDSEREKFGTTVRQLLHGAAGVVERVGSDPGDPAIFVDVVMSGARGQADPGFTFQQHMRPFVEGMSYTVDENPNDINGSWARALVAGLCEGGANALYDRLDGVSPDELAQSDVGRDAQRRFLDGLLLLAEIGQFHALEASKQRYIGELGDAPVVLVQGPPGTGKSFTTAFALLARAQAAIAERRPFRAVIACKTHAATDVLLANVVKAMDDVRLIQRRFPEIFADYFDERLLDVVLFRAKPRDAVPTGVVALNDPVKGEPKMLERIMSAQLCVVASTPGRIFQMAKVRAKQDGLFNQRFADCVVLDEASQMNLPEAIMAALPLKDNGQAIIVGDHRQMPPIVQHNWLQESRRTFQEYRAYESVFLALRAKTPVEHWIQFSESFRVHRAMAEFLREEIYQYDGIAYFSKKTGLLDQTRSTDEFVDAVLAPTASLVVVIHDEAKSQVRNEFEQALISPLLRALADRDGLALDAKTGLGVVVPHRAQRTALRESEPCLSERDPVTGKEIGSAVDTVERFQGGERDVILISATESDRQYLLVNGEFILDPRRLTVALSRAKTKLILVASRSVFELFSADEETFANAQIWKNLLRKTCTHVLWEGERSGVHVVVRGNEKINGDIVSD